MKFNHARTIDCVAVNAEKADNQSIVCAVTELAIIVLAVILMLVGVTRPLFLDTVTVGSVWLSMLLEAGAAGLYYLARWIDQNAI